MAVFGEGVEEEAPVVAQDYVPFVNLSGPPVEPDDFVQEGLLLVVGEEAGAYVDGEEVGGRDAVALRRGGFYPGGILLHAVGAEVEVALEMVGHGVMGGRGSGVEAHSGTGLGIDYLLLPVGIVEEEFPVDEEIVPVGCCAGLRALFHRRDLRFGPDLRRMLFKETGKPPGPFDEQEGGFSRAVVHDVPRDQSSGYVGLVAVERKHVVDDVVLLHLHRPPEHRHDPFDEGLVLAG